MHLLVHMSRLPLDHFGLLTHKLVLKDAVQRQQQVLRDVQRYLRPAHTCSMQCLLGAACGGMMCA